MSTPPPSSPPAPSTTASRGTRILGSISAGLLAATTLYAFVLTEPDRQLGETIRIMYLHVPTVITAYLLVLTAGGAAVFYLRKRSEFADLLGASATELAVVFLALTLVTGMLWGKPTWGTYWEWDPRLTTTALLFLMLVGNLAVRSLPSEPRVRAVRSAAMALVTLVLMPIVHKSVEWWSSLHQGRTVLGTGDANIDGTQLFALVLGMVAMPLFAGWLLMHRFRTAWLAERVADAGLDAAIRDRRHEDPGDEPGAAGVPA